MNQTPLPSPPAVLQANAPAAQGGVPIELLGVSEALSEGDGFWRSCSGCHELNEGHDTGPTSSVFKCALGNGCSECGGLGAVWDNTDYEELAVAMGATVASPACPNAAHMGEHACKDKSQCWEPCGELGNSAEHARAAEPGGQGEALSVANTQAAFCGSFYAANNRWPTQQELWDAARLAYIQTYGKGPKHVPFGEPTTAGDGLVAAQPVNNWAVRESALLEEEKSFFADYESTGTADIATIFRAGLERGFDRSDFISAKQSLKTAFALEEARSALAQERAKVSKLQEVVRLAQHVIFNMQEQGAKADSGVLKAIAASASEKGGA